MNEIIRSIESAQLKSDIPAFAIGDTVRVQVKVVEGSRERLQAFPDGWTDITGCDVAAVTDRVADALGYDDKQRAKLHRRVEKWSESTPDTPRYKAMGNSMTTHVIEILGRRIQAYDELHYDEVGQ